MDPSSNHQNSAAVFKLACVTIHHNSRPLRPDKRSGQEKEEPEFQFTFSRRHLKRYYVNPDGGDFPYLERSLDCNCKIITHSMKIDPYNSLPGCSSPLEKAVFDAFVELELVNTNVSNSVIMHQFYSVVKEAEMLATDARNKGSKKMGMRVEIVLRSNYRYDEEARMQMAMLESTEQAKFCFVPASRSAFDNLEKMVLKKDVFGGCAGYGCQICLENMEIGSEVTRMPCSHVFHWGCIDKWLGTNHVCPLCRYKLPV
ncbi:hypothetical protein Sjap_015784 [Stephania japonica]|uniref:RING-type domain-containing protein n=1 Tax=Stephania japonica TaxID=461633 RepID=A0AAP0ILS2_9MAGN